MKPLLLTAMAVMAAAEANALEIDVTPGSLCEKLPAIEVTADAMLKLSGTANVTDLALLYKMSPSVRTLDLTALNIIPYTYGNTGYMDRLEFTAGELVPNMLAGTGVIRVVLPERNVSIGKQAFALSKIEEIEIPAGVTGVGDYAFAGCGSLKKVTFLGLPSKLGKGMFRNCKNLQTVEFKQGIKNVPEGAFYGCASLKSMPAGVEKIGPQAFRYSGVTVADLRGVGEVGEYAFADAPQLATVLSDGPVSLGTGAFAGDPVLADIPELAGNAEQALAASSGNALTKRLNTEVIGEAAFANNRNISVVTLGPNVRAIKAHAFRNDTGILTVNAVALGKTVPTLDPEGFSGLKGDDGRYQIELLVDNLHVDKWKADDEWNKFNIRETSTGDTGWELDYGIYVRRQGETVTVSSATPFDNVRVTGVSGMTYYDGGEGQTEINVTVPANDISVVTARQGERLKIVKLR